MSNNNYPAGMSDSELEPEQEQRDEAPAYGEAEPWEEKEHLKRYLEKLRNTAKEPNVTPMPEVQEGGDAA